MFISDFQHTEMGELCSSNRKQDSMSLIPSKLPKPKVPSPMLWITFRQDSNGKNVMDEILVGPSLLYGIAAIVAAITGHAVLPSVLHWIK